MSFVARQQHVSQWFTALQGTICQGLEGLEASAPPSSSSFQEPGIFHQKTWRRPGGGGGTMSMLSKGRVFEKAGVNVSTVFGTLSQEMREKVPGNTAEFWASGLSLVVHPLSPYVPMIHMNIRHISTDLSWFGGGIDLTPVFPEEHETRGFHHCLHMLCEKHDPSYYPRFKKWADDYFFLPHRNEPRGIGGIFYDHLQEDWEKDWQFTKDVGNQFLSIYKPIVRKKWHQPWGETEKNQQLKKRGRYVEFNLLWDKGTQFGIHTKGSIEAIFMSLPPMASWDFLR